MAPWLRLEAVLVGRVVFALPTCLLITRFDRTVEKAHGVEYLYGEPIVRMIDKEKPNVAQAIKFRKGYTVYTMKFQTATLAKVRRLSSLIRVQAGSHGGKASYANIR